MRYEDKENFVLDYDQPIMLDGIGILVFKAQQEWNRHCARENIENPITRINEIESEWIIYTRNEQGGFNIEIGEPTEGQKARLAEAKEYRDKYLIEQEIWIGKYLLKNFGYDALFNFAQTHNEKKFRAWFETVRACDGAIEQYNIFCAQYRNCELKGENNNGTFEREHDT